MTEQETIAFIVDNINTTNRLLCEQSGMTKEEIDKRIEESRLSMSFIVANLYEKMKEAKLLA